MGEFFYSVIKFILKIVEKAVKKTKVEHFNAVSNLEKDEEVFTLFHDGKGMCIISKIKGVLKMSFIFTSL